METQLIHSEKYEWGILGDGKVIKHEFLTFLSVSGKNPNGAVFRILRGLVSSVSKRSV